MSNAALIAIGLWASVAVFLFGRAINLGRKTLNNLKPGTGFGTLLKNRHQWNPDIYTDMGQVYRRKRDGAAVVLLVWLFAGWLILAIATAATR